MDVARSMKINTKPTRQCDKKYAGKRGCVYVQGAKVIYTSCRALVRVSHCTQFDDIDGGDGRTNLTYATKHRCEYGHENSKCAHMYKTKTNKTQIIPNKKVIRAEHRLKHATRTAPLVRGFGHRQSAAEYVQV